MLISKYFLTVEKDKPKETYCISHSLMIQTGMIQQTSSGIFTWLPLGFKILNKINNIIREEQEKIGGLEILLPNIQEEILWQNSGRIDSYGEEMLKIKNRKNKRFVFAPTNEEQITEIIKKKDLTYKNLPLLLFCINNKFRDEIRPKFGIIRCKEFLMKDTYSFDVNHEMAEESYWKVISSYLKIFHRIDLKVVIVPAEAGAIGGSLNHEIIALHKKGETKIVSCCTAPLQIVSQKKTVSWKDLKTFCERHKIKIIKEKHEYEKGFFLEGTEVGHVFYFGNKYSKALNSCYTNKEGKKQFYKMGSYGIGPSRLVAAIIEANNDEKGICWPYAVAPFHVVIIPVLIDEEHIKYSRKIYEKILIFKIDVLLNDKKQRFGEKIHEMDLIGIPIQIIIGKHEIKMNEITVKERKTMKKKMFQLDIGLKVIENLIFSNFTR